MREDTPVPDPQYAAKAGAIAQAAEAAEAVNAVKAVKAFVGMGANLGDRLRALIDALAAINALPGTRVVGASPLYRTAPIDASGPDYLNAVAEVATTLAPHTLLTALQTIEQAAGRERPYRNAPRTLDLDLLLYGHARIASPGLTVPHPRMGERAFVLLPLREIAPGLVKDAALRAVATQTIERLGANGRASLKNPQPPSRAG